MIWFLYCRERGLLTLNSISPLWHYWHLALDSSSFRRRQWHPTPVLLPGKSHGRRSLVGCSPWGCQESDTTEQLHFYFSLSCIGEGNGNPLQCSCLENPRDGGAWWAAVYGVAQSRTRLRNLAAVAAAALHFQGLCPVHWRIVSRIPLKASSSFSPSNDIKIASRHCQMSPGRHNHPCWEHLP